MSERFCKQRCSPLYHKTDTKGARKTDSVAMDRKQKDVIIKHSYKENISRVAVSEVCVMNVCGPTLCCVYNPKITKPQVG